MTHHVYPCDGESGVHNHSLASLRSLNEQLRPAILFGNQGRNIRFEQTRACRPSSGTCAGVRRKGPTESSDDQADNEWGDSALLFDNSRDGRDDQNNMANESDDDGDADGIESTPVRVSDVGPE